MARVKIVKPTQDEYLAARNALLTAVDRGELSIGQAVKHMRKVLSMSQTVFAERVAKVSRKALSQIENDSGDPKLSTLNACGKAFGLSIGFVRKSPHTSTESH